MNFTSLAILSLVIAYLIGSFSFAIFVSKKLQGEDIRKYGSGNPGAANMTRTMGIKAGAITLLGDALKGALATFLALFFGGPFCAYIAAYAVFLGHCFPLYHDFKGGKGVATAAGAFLVLDGNIFLLFVATWALTVILTRYMGLAAIIGALAYPVGVIFFHIVPNFNSIAIFMSSPARYLYISFFILSLLFPISITFLHRGNISRMIKRAEPRMDFKKHDKEEKYG